MRHLVNTTFIVEPEITGEWISWLGSHYIAAAMSDPVCAVSPLLCRILAPMEGGEGYALQMIINRPDMAAYFTEKLQPRLLETMAERFGTRAMGFTTLMEVVDI